MQTSDISNHFTPLDRSILVGDDAYNDYFNYLRFALDNLLNSLDSYKSDQPFEIAIVKGFAQKFLNTMELFKLKYAFNETHPMLVDLTESSFPNHLEFKRLDDDLQRKTEKLKGKQSEETLKMLILDSLLKNKEHPKKLLKEISQRSYFETLQEEDVFTQFCPGELKLLKRGKGPERRYLYSWGSFDTVTNRPFIYMLVFDYVAEKNNTLTIMKEMDFANKIQRLTHNTAPLKVMASDLDELDQDLLPKVLKRIDLGPIYGMYSKDEHRYSKMLKEKFTEDDFIFAYQTEVIFSVGEKRNSSFLSKGELRQIFFIDEANKECMEKMVSQLFKYQITSHAVWQHMHEYHREDLDQLASKPHIYPAK